MATTVKRDWVALSETTVMTVIVARKGNGLVAMGSAPSDDLDTLFLAEGDTLTVNAGVTPYVKADATSHECVFTTLEIAV